MAGFSFTWGEALGAGPGLIALVGALVGYGKMQARVTELETMLKQIPTIISDVVAIKTEQRSFGGRMDRQDTALQRISDKIDRVLENQSNRNRN